MDGSADWSNAGLELRSGRIWSNLFDDVGPRRRCIFMLPVDMGVGAKMRSKGMCENKRNGFATRSHRYKAVCVYMIPVSMNVVKQ